MSSLTPHARKIFDTLMADKYNQRCIDCSSKLSVDWASVNLGVYFCIDCSGKHRGLGVHISFVRSITMDKWDDRQLAFMQAGGNKACKTFLKENDCYDLPMAERWASKGAEKWRQRLKKIVDAQMKSKSKKKPVSESETETETESETESEDEVVVTKPVKKTAAAKPASKPPAKAAAKVPDMIDLIDLGPPEEPSESLDDFFSDAKPAKAVVEAPAARKSEEKLDKKEKEKKKEKKSSSKSSSSSSSALAMDQASVEARIEERKQQKDREREAAALAKLEAMCGTSSSTSSSTRKAEKKMKWGNENPPSKGSSSESDSGSESEDEMEKRERLKRLKKKEAKAAAKKGLGGEGDQANPSTSKPVGPESTMARLRREAEEAKAMKERERQDHIEKLGARSAISSSDFFPDQQGGMRQANKDYSNMLDGYTGDKPLQHAILHKGVFSKDTMVIAKDKVAEVVPEVAGRAGTTIAAAAATAASYLGSNAGGWLNSAKDKMGLAGNSMSSSSGSWIDQEARRRAEVQKNGG
eukprot:CAMPEP_0181311306 /NCGR_PEP_ID=MMETSP1101-20121128/13062_1 /TAXON_ID=46948 /ORGANISM="Rhodomonas abbreviata, Strain Caron Lab Isolate" /LENGTH=525 /DNA_ID=CAMNT_0023418019 /DNA_START=163 /DNA_END=1736 /DNA_ORIENTATION=-